MDNLTITFQTVLAFFGAVAVIGGGIKLILEATTPFKQLHKRQNDMEAKLDNDNKRFKEIESNYKELKDTINQQNKLLIQIADHLITGNDVDELKRQRDKLLDHVIKK